MNKNRIVVFDYMRGYFMLCILLNHLSLYPSFFQYVTGRGGMWTSAAEGFFFISGIMVGLIRGKEYKESQSIKIVAKKLFKRSFKIYLLYLAYGIFNILIFLILLRININPSPATIGGNIKIVNFNQTLWEIMTFYSYYGWADFLRFYVVFLLLAVPFLWILKQKMWYLLLGLAIIAWFEPRLAQFPFDQFYFYWSSYFILGMIFGYYFEEIKIKFNKLSLKNIKIIKFSAIALSATILISNWLINYFAAPKSLKVEYIIRSLTLYKWRSSNAISTLFYSDRTGILRLPVFLILVVGLFFLFKYFENYIKIRLDWLLGELGRNSLRAYVVGAFYTYIFRLWVVDTAFIYNTIVSASFLGIILITLKNRIITRYVPN